MATLNISLPDAMRAWVHAQVQTGEYANASDYLRDLIRHDQHQRETGVHFMEGWTPEALRAAIQEGLESGIAVPYDGSLLERIKARGRERLAAKEASS